MLQNLECRGLESLSFAISLLSHATFARREQSNDQ